MSRPLLEIWRHPIKSHGREALNEVLCEPGKTLPQDRRWAVLHEAAKGFSGEWQPCSQFVIGAKSPRLAAIRASYDEPTGCLTMTHPDLSELTINPDKDDDAARFIAWMRPLAAPNRPQPQALVSAGTRGMTDSDYPSVSLINLASHRAVEAGLGREISPLRWRGNFLFESETAWEEMDWAGKRLKLGDVILEGIEPIERCTATMASTRTGTRDADTLATLQSFGHQHCGLYARIVQGGMIRIQDQLEVL